MSKTRGRSRHDSDYREASKASRWALGQVLIWATAVVLVAGALSLFWVKVIEPDLLSGEGKANRHSYQYTEGQRAFLLRDLTSSQQLDTEIATLQQRLNSGTEDSANRDTDNTLLDGKNKQKKGLLADMRNRVNLLDDPSLVPSEVRDYLTKNK